MITNKMDRETIESIAEKYGFTLWSINNASTLQFMDSRGINLLVHENGDYELKWLIPNTIFTIECPKCSPFGSEHFEKMLAKFRIEVTFRSFQEVEDGD